MCVIPKTTFSPPVANVSKPPAVLNDLKKTNMSCTFTALWDTEGAGSKPLKGEGGGGGQGWVGGCPRFSQEHIHNGVKVLNLTNTPKCI